MDEITVKTKIMIVEVLENGTHISLAWVFRYSRITGNETTDLLAIREGKKTGYTVSP